MSDLKIIDKEGKLLLKTGDALLDPSKVDDIHPIVHHLVAQLPEMTCQTNGLAKVDESAMLIDFIGMLPFQAQRDILVGQEHKLICHAYRLASAQPERTLDLIKEHPASNREAILSAPSAVWGLIRGGRSKDYFGQGRKVIDFIKAQPKKARINILSARGAKDAIEMVIENLAEFDEIIAVLDGATSKGAARPAKQRVAQQRRVSL